MIAIITYLLCSLWMGTYNGQEREPVVAVTYNIRMDNPGDNQDNWHQRKADMILYLQSLQADFMGVQEALDHQLTYLDHGLSTYDVIGVGRDDGLAGGEYSAILYDTTEWHAIESSTFWLSATPHLVSRGWDAACHRVVTYGVFTRASGDTVMVANTHFDHVGQIARSESVRLIQRSLASYDHLPVILMGDFNFTPDDEKYQFLAKSFTDAYAVSDAAPELAGTFNGFGKDADASRRIDYIWHSDRLACTAYQVDRPKTKSDRQLSDHYPVIANFLILQV